ncbi:Surp module [Eremomyces bilateralis CBS 781.70]|uniref:Surp module n=1 Tax=Eremomyces bilateralis CBS 781.70 TaxID=1392243 RepID=A0A6G1FWR8_9PEZI|nr:Surp module [Eremomyces bilateralis CBS 781.70]KAF1810131.1 Surp module [Eremomyces bilateralis CBS 781.70]
MAPAADTSFEEVVSKPPPGVVLPPKDIRAIVEKTAGYVARNGTVFEERIRTKEQQNPKFSFLSENDAYNPFYAWRLSEVKEGRGTAVSAGRVEEGGAVKAPEKPKGPEPPPDFQFSARMPNISAQDLDVVKLTALYVAKNGRGWMTQLSQKESGNYQFDFLRPQHSLYQYFSRLVDQYTELLNGGVVNGGKAEKGRIQQLQGNVTDRYRVLEKARRRAEWVKYQEQQRQQKEEAEEADRFSYAQIDWHDFVVVETVLFNETDDHTELPPPTSLNDLQSASLEQKAMMSLAPHTMRIEEAMPTDDMQQAYFTPSPAAATPFPPPHIPQPPISPQPMGPPMPMAAASHAPNDRLREQMAANERAQQAQAAAKGGPGTMKIRSDYVPRAQAKRQQQNGYLCPNCKQVIPAEEWENHMKIELLDPNWREQKALSDQRQSTTNLSTAEVANNLKRLASQRSDVFDPITGQAITPEEEQRRKMAKLQAAEQVPVPPGAVGAVGGDGRGLQGLSLEEQIRQLHQRYR